MLENLHIFFKYTTYILIGIQINLLLPEFKNWFINDFLENKENEGDNEK